jgi:hypothetical protein
MVRDDFRQTPRLFAEKLDGIGLPEFCVLSECPREAGENKSVASRTVKGTDHLVGLRSSESASNLFSQAAAGCGRVVQEVV